MSGMKKIKNAWPGEMHVKGKEKMLFRTWVVLQSPGLLGPLYHVLIAFPLAI